MIRPLRAHDLPALKDLHAALLPVHYPPHFFLQLLIIPERLCLVATNDGKLIGFVSAALHIPAPCDDQLGTIPSTPPRLELLTLGVAPAYQNAGIATMLVKAVHDSLRTRLKTRPDRTSLITCAHVATANTPAIAFYKRIGLFVIPESIIRGFYRTKSGPRDAHLVMGVLL